MCASCIDRHIYFSFPRADQYIKDSKVEICRGGRSTIAVEAIVSCVDPGGGSIDSHC